jgi:cytochrome P450
MTLTTALADEARLTDPRFFADDPFPAFARLRAEAPVFWCEKGGFWALSRYDDVRTVGRDAERFTSTKGIAIADRDARGRAKDHYPEGSIHPMLIDPPLHTHIRRVVSSAFTPAAVGKLEPMVRSIVCEVLDQIEPGTTGNVVDLVSAPIPIWVIAALFDVPRSMWADFRRWSDSVIQLGDATDGDEHARHAANVADLNAYFDEAIAARRSTPGDDLLSMIAAGTRTGDRPLTSDDMVVYCNLLTVAGNETTRNTITGGIRSLGLHPEQRTIMIEEPHRAPKSTDEILRWVSPVQAFARTATRDTVIRDQPIAEGDYVVMLYPSANRDEAVWADADQLDVTRPSDPPHVAFGFGPHMCVGAALARLEIDIVFEELLRRFPCFELAGEHTSVPASVVYVIDDLPVTFSATPGA